MFCADLGPEDRNQDDRDGEAGILLHRNGSRLCGLRADDSTVRGPFIAQILLRPEDATLILEYPFRSDGHGFSKIGWTIGCIFQGPNQNSGTERSSAYAAASSVNAMAYVRGHQANYDRRIRPNAATIHNGRGWSC